MLVNRHLKQNTVIELTEKQLEKVMFVTTWFTTFPVNITAGYKLFQNTDLNRNVQTKIKRNVHLAEISLDCEQSLFFFRFSESNALARERRSRETRETRAARLAPSVTRVAICVSRVLLDGLQKKERLLVV